MDSYIQISKLNDYIFCPRSVYLHSIYESFDTDTYHSHYQTAGKIAHESIDSGAYSTLKKYRIGMPVYSNVHRLAGKIDIYDCDAKLLVERKKLVKKIFDGYRYQLYAQMICLEEMGYPVDALVIRSLDDNRRFPIVKPTTEQLKPFFDLIARMRDNSNPANWRLQTNLAKCAHCIYRPLCREDGSPNL